MNQKGFSNILLGIIIAVLALGTGAYVLIFQRASVPTTPSQTPSDVETEERSQSIVESPQDQKPAINSESFQGVWELSKILISAGYQTQYGYWDEEPLTVDRKSYLVFLGDKVCQSKTILELEAICHNAYGSFNGKAIDVPYYNPSSVAEDILSLSGDVFLKNEQLELHTEAGKGSGILRHIYTKTIFRAEPPQDTPLSQEEMNRRAIMFKKNAEAILANFNSWKTAMEEEAAIWGVTFSSDHTPRIYDIPLESLYHHLHIWAERAQKALDNGEYRAAHRFAAKAEESFLIFMELAPGWREVYGRTGQ